MASELLNLYLSWERLAKTGIEIGKISSEEAKTAFLKELPISKVVVIGIGGSGIVGDFLRTISIHYDFPVDVRSARALYHTKLDRETLLISISYSGDTLEVIEQTMAAFNKVMYTVGVTRGGILEETLKSRRYPVLKLPSGYPSRVAFPLMFYSILTFLSSLGFTGSLSLRDIESSLKVLRETGSVNEDATRYVDEARWAEAIITTHSEYMPVAQRLKNEIAENAKTFVSVEELPEWFHNTIEAIGDDRREIILIKGKMTDRYDCFLDAAEAAIGRPFYEVKLRGESHMEELVYGAWLSGIVSLRLADKLERKADTTKRLESYRDHVSRLCKTR